MGRHLRLEQLAQESMDFLIPFFSEFYSISIRIPLVRAPVWKKERDFSGLFTPEGRNGLIELNRQHCNIEKGYHGVVAHELGHAAEYQHHKTYFNPIEDKEKDFIYDALREGIAMEFERAGLGGCWKRKLLQSSSLMLVCIHITIHFLTAACFRLAGAVSAFCM